MTRYTLATGKPLTRIERFDLVLDVVEHPDQRFELRDLDRERAVALVKLTTRMRPARHECNPRVTANIDLLKTGPTISDQVACKISEHFIRAVSVTTDREVKHHHRKTRGVIAPHLGVDARLASGDR